MAEMFQAAFEQAMIGMALVAPDGHWLRVNRALCALLGYTEAELLAVGFRPLIERDALAVGGDGLARLLAGAGDEYEIEQPFPTGDAREIWLHLYICLVRDRSRQPDYLIVQAQDVTARRVAEQERARALAQLQRSNGELERFAAVASHDLQEPLRKIRAFGDRLLATERDRVSERGRDSLARMQHAATRMQELIDGLLAYSRIAGQSAELVAVELDALLADVRRDLDGQLARTAGRIEVGPLPIVPGEPLRLRQLFQNLLANALKFHQPGVPPMITITAEALEERPDPAAPDPAGRHWRIAVTDNGIGFDEQYGERIFGMFQRLHGRNEYEGSGIGLALCRRIAEQHGGQIVARGRPGAGATFTLTLPAERVGTRPAGRSEEEINGH